MDFSAVGRIPPLTRISTIQLLSLLGLRVLRFHFKKFYCIVVSAIIKKSIDGFLIVILNIHVNKNYKELVGLCPIVVYYSYIELNGSLIYFEFVSFVQQTPCLFPWCRPTCNPRVHACILGLQQQLTFCLHGR